MSPIWLVIRHTLINPRKVQLIYHRPVCSENFQLLAARRKCADWADLTFEYIQKADRNI